MGIWPALWNLHPDPHPQAQWAERLMRAHANAVESLVVFAPLVLALQVLGMSTAITATAAMVYFIVRAAHAILHTFTVPPAADGGISYCIFLPDGNGLDSFAGYLR